MERTQSLTIGRTYTNRNGNEYLCIGHAYNGDGSIMERTKDSWTLTAHGITVYNDGTIEWDYSTGGRWTRKTF